MENEHFTEGSGATFFANLIRAASRFLQNISDGLNRLYQHANPRKQGLTDGCGH